ncbi:Serpin (serine protease inhibitor) [Popillia japonica]|uniref:Serpin (Serine protease inhibitor) n=1 Tax=Popillia japonica TaxID=7064 RepID=A0AAW1LBT5_POPJA
MKLFYTSLIITAIVTTICSAISVPNSMNFLTRYLYHNISKDDNWIISPLSTHLVLSLAYIGADGETAKTFRHKLLLPNQRTTASEYRTIIGTLHSDKYGELNIANYFDAYAANIDFTHNTAAAKTINDWVKEKTHDKIDSVFGANALNSNTRALLLNAIYFKGTWSSPFNEEDTHLDVFYTSETAYIIHPMMIQEGYFKYEESEDLDSKILTMIYADPRFIMTIILPNKRTGMHHLESKLSNGFLYTDQAKKAKEHVLVRLPKFNIESTSELEATLKEVGLQQIFSNSANFSNMIEAESDFRISKIVQKAFIEVDEHGTETAKVFGDQVQRVSAKTDRRLFNADHPFMFYISASTGRFQTILFVGKVVSPSYK